MSIIQENLMSQKDYSPYCGNMGNCSYRSPRTKFNGEQFTCKCGWVSQFPNDFITEYKDKWELSK